MSELIHPIVLLQTTDWSSLIHALGYATDTPGHLMALIGDDPVLQQAAVAHLGTSIFGKDLVWPTTAIVGEVVLGMMLTPSCKPKLEPIRAELERFLLRIGTIGRMRRAMNKAKLDSDQPITNISHIQKLYCKRIGLYPENMYYKLKINSYSVKLCLDFVQKLSFDGISCLEDRALIARITGVDGVEHSYMALTNPDTLFSCEVNTPRQKSPSPLLTIIHPKQLNRKVLPSDKLEPPTENV